MQYMVNVIDCGRNKFFEIIKEKKLYCFGAGKNFIQFSDEQPDLKLSGIIDNYKDGSQMMLHDRPVEIISINRFVSGYNSDCLLLITVEKFEDIVRQLDSYEELDGMQCFVEVMIREHDKLADVEKGDVLYQSWDDARADYEKLLLQNRVEKIKHRNTTRALKKDSKDSKNAIEKFQIWECLTASNIAGGKAPADVYEICVKAGYQPVYIHPYSGDKNTEQGRQSREKTKTDWQYCYDRISENAILFLQHPFWQEQEERNETLRKLKANKRVRIISLVHDVESLRGVFQTPYMKKEFQFMLENADVIIVHNDRMLQYFVEMGVDSAKLVSLELFDYLSKQAVTERHLGMSVAVAGNLDPVKSKYIEKLGELDTLEFHLFGPNYQAADKKKTENLIYHGAYPADLTPHKLVGSFGLVWDGDSLDGCDGMMGNYMRYNNPHKLSLYMAAGLPIIIWSEAAEAALVKRKGIGVTISSLYELEGILGAISAGQYAELVRNVKKEAKKIENGFYTKNAVLKSENIILR